MADADPRRSFGFRRRVVLARAAAGFEALWAALWPTLALLGVFLVVSLLGLWTLLPAWLHALGLAAPGARPGAGALWRARHAFLWPSQDAGLRRLERINALPHQPLRSLGDRLSGGAADPATSSLWRRHQERLRAGAPPAPGRAAALRPAAARPVGAARRAAPAAAGGAGRGRRHRAQAPAPGVRAAARRPAGRGPDRADPVGDAAALHRQAAGPARGRAPGGGRARGGARSGARSRCPPAARRSPSCTISPRRPRTSRSSWASRPRRSPRSPRAAPRPAC